MAQSTVNSALILSGIRRRAAAPYGGLLLAALLTWTTGLAAAGPDAGKPPLTAAEYKVKAAFLYNFTKYVEWPAETPASSWAVCIIGVDPFGVALDAIVGRLVQEKPVTVRRMQWLDDVTTCRVIFVSASEHAHLAQILSRIRDLPALTVSDIPDFLERGGMILFHLEGTKVRFSINQEASQRSRLKISGELLRLARRVYGNIGEHP